MFGIYETHSYRKSRAFNNVSFHSVKESESWLNENCKGNINFEYDSDNNAADFFYHGIVYCVEKNRLTMILSMIM